MSRSFKRPADCVKLEEDQCECLPSWWCMTGKENISRISAPDRIERLLAKACEAKLGAMLRLNEADTIAVRGVMTEMVTIDGARAIKISGLSTKGVQYLSAASHCIVELVLMNAKVAFAAIVVKFFGDAIFLSVPQELVNIERRKNARYPVPPNQAAFIKFSGWIPKSTDPVAPPCVFGFETFNGWIRVSDLSFGGLSAQMLVPGPVGQLERGYEDHVAMLHLPSQEPVKVHCAIRWTKRISDWSMSNPVNKYTRVFRLGVEFVSPDQKFTTIVHQAIREFSTAGAV